MARRCVRDAVGVGGIECHASHAIRQRSRQVPDAGGDLVASANRLLDQTRPELAVCAEDEELHALTRPASP
jgi:hypothetical protein